MSVKEFLNTLKQFDSNMEIQFYYLKDHNLNNCELESILDADGQIEITIKESEVEWWLG